MKMREMLLEMKMCEMFLGMKRSKIFLGMKAFAPFFQKIKVLLPPCAAEMERGAAFNVFLTLRRKFSARAAEYIFAALSAEDGFGGNFSARAALGEIFQPVRRLRNFLRAIKESSSAEKARNSQESAR